MARIRPERVSWGPIDAVVLGSVAVAACYGFPNLLWSGSIESAQTYFLRTLVISLWLFVPTVMWLRTVRKAPLAQHWLPADTVLRDAVVGVQLALIFAVVNGIGIKLLFERPFDQPAGEMFRVMRESYGTWDISLLVIGVAVLAPVAEEVFFRGMLYPAMRRYMGPFQAVIFNAALFAIAHGRNRAWGTFLLGLVASIMMEYTGSLVVPILLHVGTNFAFVAFLVRQGQLARTMPMWLLMLIFVVMNVHLFLAGKLLFGARERPESPSGADPGATGGAAPRTAHGTD